MKTHQRRAVFRLGVVGLLGLTTFWPGGVSPLWADDGPASTTASQLELQPCHIDNYRQEVRCGRYTVYEDREAATGRQIDLRFAVIPAVDEAPLPDPLVFFAGGPGQAAMDMAPLVRRVFRGVNEQREVVLIDQRGIGASHALECDEPDEDQLLGLTEDELFALSRDLLTECLNTLDADVTQYTQDIANADIHDVLRALGYESINIYGGSWGTRSALLYAHRYPEHVRTMVLDGALPLANTAPRHAAADGSRALELVLDDCAADTACQRAFPNLRQDYQTAVDRLGSEGRRVEVVDATSGKLQPMVLTADRFGDALRSILYVPDLSRAIPLIIRQASVGDYRALSGVFGYLASMSGGAMTPGASLTIFCSEELARMAPENGAAPVNGLLGDGMLNNLENACSVWPKAPVPSIYRENVSSDAPTLVLSGEVDPITPPSWGDAMAEGLGNALHLVAPATGHNVAPRGCAPELIEQLIDQGTLDGIDGACLQDLKRPSFFVDLSGPLAGAPSGDAPSGDEPATDGGVTQ